MPYFTVSLWKGFISPLIPTGTTGTPDFIVKNAYDLNYGYNYFPEKSYKGINYPAGEYESLVVTLGDGLGDNWWCVLFPPLCLLEASESDLDEAEYTFYFKDIINKFS